MAVIAGIDEAGYGPRIGPLVLSTVIMELPAGYGHETDIWHLLKDTISDTIQKRGNRIVVNDSKKTFSQKRGLKILEETVLSFIWNKRGGVTRFSDLLKSVSNHNNDVFDKYPWYKGKDITIPVASDVPSILQFADLIKKSIRLQNVTFHEFRSNFLCVHEINREIQCNRNKASLLFNSCLQLLKEIFHCFGDRDPQVLIDKHGGRNYYHQLLTKGFTGYTVNTISEGKSGSTYTILDEKKKMNVSFIESADAKYFPTALASMFSKYIRELFIRLFNTFWQEEINDIRPTAGYPEDAKRFLSEIYDTRIKLGIADNILIRVK